jgi:hypothetical protein
VHFWDPATDAGTAASDDLPLSPELEADRLHLKKKSSRPPPTTASNAGGAGTRSRTGE